MSDVLAFYNGRPVVVTGCSSGIGGAVAQKLSGAGASVIGIDRNPPKTDLAQFIETDLGNPESIASSRVQPACGGMGPIQLRRAFGRRRRSPDGAPRQFHRYARSASRESSRASHVGARL